MQMKAPFILVGDGQVEFFRTIETLVRSVEAIDAAEFCAYDAKGYLIRLVGDCQKLKGWFGLRSIVNGPVTAIPMTNAPPQVDQLHAALLDWWNATGGAARNHTAPHDRHLSLDELIDAIGLRDGIQ